MKILQKIKILIYSFAFLMVTLVIKAQVPSWSVDQSLYPYSMTIIGVININGVESVNSNNMIAAFIDNECRGVVNLKEISSINRWEFFLTIYHTESSGTISFKVYNSSVPETIDIDAAGNIDFEINAAIGGFRDPIVISDPILQSGADMLSISFDSNIQLGSTTQNGNTFTANILNCTDITSLVPVFTLSDGATAEVNTVLQTSGTSSNNFLSPVVYEVTSSDLSTTNSFTVNVNLVNSAPSGISLSGGSIPENSALGTTVGTFTTSDENSCDNHMYELVSGSGDNNNSLFKISGDQLKIEAEFDYEKQLAYSIRVRTDDNNGGKKERVFNIGITNVNDEIPVIEDGSISIKETTAAGSVIYTTKASDKDANSSLSFSLSDGIPAASYSNYFKIDSKTGAILTKKELDVDVESSFQLEITVSDGTNTASGKLDIAVTRVNESPSSIEISQTEFDEGSYYGQTLASFSTFDPDGDTNHTWELVRGEGDSDNYLFELIDNLLVSNTNFDFETKESYSLRVRVSDQYDGVLEKQFSLQIINVNDEVPVVQNATVRITDDINVGAEVYQVDAGDNDKGAVLVYSIQFGNTDGAFSIDPVTGMIHLEKALDFDKISAFSLSVEVADDDYTHKVSANIQIIVEDINHSPTNILLSQNEFEEDIKFGSLLANFETIDEDLNDVHTYLLMSGTVDNKFFSIKENGLFLQTEFDYTEQSSYTIRVQTNDANGGTFEKSFVLNIKNLDLEAPEVQNETIYVSDETEINTVVCSIQANDPDSDSPLSFKIEDGNTNETFILDSNKGDIIIHKQLNSDIVSVYELKVLAYDGYNTGSGTIKIIVNNINYSPDDIMLSQSEFPEGGYLGIELAELIASDKNADDDHIFSLVNDEEENDNQYFAISDGMLIAQTDFDYEEKSVYSIHIQADDKNGGIFSKKLELHISDVEPDPATQSRVFIYFTDTTKQGNGIGVLTSDKFTAEINWTGWDDFPSDYFSLSETGHLTVINDMIAEEQPKFQFSAIASDGNIIDTVEVFIFVQAVNFQPEDVGLSNSYYDENVSFGSFLGEFSTEDPDKYDKHSYSLTGFDRKDNLYFKIQGDSLFCNTDFDFERIAAYEIEIQTSDGAGGVLVKPFQLTINDINDEKPILNDTIVYLGTSLRQGSIITQLRANDRDKESKITYSFIKGASDNIFDLNEFDGKLTLLKKQGTENQFTLTIRSFDGMNSDTANINLIIYKDNSAPVSLFLSNNTITEGNRPGAIIGYLSAIDSDIEDTHSYYFDYSVEENDNYNFEIIDSALIIKTVSDFEEKNTYTVSIKVDDNNGGQLTKEFTVKILDKDDAPPVVEDVFISIADTLKAGAEIGELVVSDSDTDGGFTFAITSGNTELLFKIDANTGHLYLNTDLSTGMKKQFQLVASIFDGANTAFSNVTVTINIPETNEEVGPNVTSGLKELSFQGHDAEITTNSHMQQIDIKVAANTDISKLIANYTLGEGLEAYIDEVLQVPGVTENDFSKPLTITIENDKGDQSHWLILVSQEEQSSEAIIHDFNLPNETDFAVINKSTNRIDAYVSPSTDITSLRANFTSSIGASVFVNDVLQESGTSANDFTKPVLFTVVAEDGSTQKWIVTVHQQWAISVENVEADKIQVFPNPVHDIVFVQLPNIDDCNVTIYNKLGQKIYQNEYIGSNILKIDMANFDLGYYIISVQSHNNTCTSKILKMK